MDLASLIADEGPLRPGEVADLARQLGAELDDLHAAGRVHGDLRTASVELSGSGAGQLHASLRMPGTAPGEAALHSGAAAAIAPEQILGLPLDRRTDVYALACVMWEALVGCEPFVRESESAVREAHLNDLRPLASELGAPVGGRADEVLQRGMARDPDGRPPTAGAFARELSAALEGPAPGTMPHWTAAAVVLALAAIGATGAWALLRGDDSPRDRSDATSLTTVARTATTTGPSPARLPLDDTHQAAAGLRIRFPAGWRVRSRARSRTGATVAFEYVTLASGPFARAPMYLRIVVGGPDDTALFARGRLARLLARARASARGAFRWKTSFRAPRGLRVARSAGRRADLDWRVAPRYSGLGFAFAGRNRADGRWLYGFAVYDTWDSARVRPGRLLARRDTLRAIVSSLRWG